MCANTLRPRFHTGKCFKCFTRSFQGCTPSYHSKLQLKCQVEVQQFVGIVSCARPVHVHQISFIVGPMSSCNACHASSYLVATWWPCRVQRLEKCLGCLLVIHHHDAIWSHVPSMYNPTILTRVLFQNRPLPRRQLYMLWWLYRVCQDYGFICFEYQATSRQLSLPTPQLRPSLPTCCLKTSLPTTTLKEIFHP